MLGSSVMDFDWLDQIDYSGEAVLVIAEDILMYLSEDEVKKLFIALKGKFTDSEIIFDAFSNNTVKFSKYQPSLKKTEAKISWGVDSPNEIEGFAHGIKHLYTKYMNVDNRINSLNWYFKFMFKLTKNIKAVQ